MRELRSVKFWIANGPGKNRFALCPDFGQKGRMLSRVCSAAVSGIFALLLSGCGKSAASKNSDFAPLQNGFCYVTHVHGITDPSLTTGLWYRCSDGKAIQVWPQLQLVWGDNLQITNNLILFVGGITSISKDGQERLTDRLMTFRAPAGPPIEITDHTYFGRY